MKYIIFGDSFTAPPKFTNLDRDYVWYKQLDHEYITHGVSGTSIWYSMDKLMDYLNSDDYNENDRIIFVSTSANRAIRYTDNKFIHQQNLINSKKSVRTGNKEWDDYHQKNFLAHNYITENVLTVERHLHIEKLIYELLEGLPNQTLMLYAFAHVDSTIPPKTIKKLFSHNNFIQYAKKKQTFKFDYDNMFTLYRASAAEFMDYNATFNGMFKDPRLNHFSKSNHKILADLIVEFFKTRDYSIFSLDKFNSKFLTPETVKEEHGKR